MKVRRSTYVDLALLFLSFSLGLLNMAQATVALHLLSILLAVVAHCRLMM